MIGFWFALHSGIDLGLLGIGGVFRDCKGDIVRLFFFDKLYC